MSAKVQLYPVPRQVIDPVNSKNTWKDNSYDFSLWLAEAGARENQVRRSEHFFTSWQEIRAFYFHLIKYMLFNLETVLNLFYTKR